MTNEDDCPDYITKLLPRNSDLRSDSRASRYGRFNLACPFYNRETDGGGTFKVRGASISYGIGLPLIQLFQLTLSDQSFKRTRQERKAVWVD